MVPARVGSLDQHVDCDGARHRLIPPSPNGKEQLVPDGTNTSVRTEQTGPPYLLRERLD